MIIPSRNAIACPDNVASDLATAIPDAIATPIHIARRSQLRTGDRVAIIGAGGGVGVHMLQVALLMGADVLALDVDAKLGFLADQFSVATVDSSDFTRLSMLPSWRHGADVVIDLLGTRASTEWAIDALGMNGRLVVLTTFPDQGFQTSQRGMVLKQLSVIASRYSSRHEVAAGADLVSRGLIRPIIGSTRRLSAVTELHDLIKTSSLVGRAAVLLA